MDQYMLRKITLRCVCKCLHAINLRLVSEQTDEYTLKEGITIKGIIEIHVFSLKILVGLARAEETN